MVLSRPQAGERRAKATMAFAGCVLQLAPQGGPLLNPMPRTSPSSELFRRPISSGVALPAVAAVLPCLVSCQITHMSAPSATAVKRCQGPERKGGKRGSAGLRGCMRERCEEHGAEVRILVSYRGHMASPNAVDRSGVWGEARGLPSSRLLCITRYVPLGGGGGERGKCRALGAWPSPG